MAHLFDLHGKCALIAGSSRGIGLVIAETFADQGANVAISSHHKDSCDAAARRINARHAGRAASLQVNIGRKAELIGLVEEMRAIVGQIAAAAVFLAPAAGSYITGQSPVIDGGVTITIAGIRGAR